MFFAGADASSNQLRREEAEKRRLIRAREYRLQPLEEFKSSLCFRFTSTAFTLIAQVMRGIVREMRLAVAGMIGGLASIGYIFALMLLVMYMYAVLGILLFRDNDPWHWGSLEEAFVTLVRVAILDYWTQILYINYYGCDYYNGDYYASPDDVDDIDYLGDPGAVIVCYTDRDEADANGGAYSTSQPLLASVFLVSYIFVAAFCVLSLVIGVISIAMFDSMATLKAEDAHITEEGIAQTMVRKGPKDRRTRMSLDFLKLVMHGHKPEIAIQRRVTASKVIAKAWRLQSWNVACEAYGREGWQGLYEVLCDSSAAIVEDATFGVVVNVCIVYVSFLAGAGTSSSWEELYAPVKQPIEDTITGIFTVEVVLKILAEKEGHYLFFLDPWNILDFVVVVFSYLSFLPSNLVMLARMVRLLRLLKLVRMLPELQQMTEAMMDGVKNTMSIGMLLIIYLYLFAMLGNHLFAKNDPHRFGDPILGMITLFQIATCDAWADAFYTSAYGCHVYGYNEWECDVEDAKGQYLAASLFFNGHLFLGGFVMLTLFVGIMSLSLEERAEGMLQASGAEDELGAICEEYDITPANLERYRTVFEFIDISDNKTLEEIELLVAISIAGVDRTRHVKLWKAFKRSDDDEAIDFATFLRYLMLLRREHVYKKRGQHSKSFLLKKEVQLEAHKKQLLKAVDEEWKRCVSTPAGATELLEHERENEDKHNQTTQRRAATTPGQPNLVLYPIDPVTGLNMSPMSPLKIESPPGTDNMKMDAAGEMAWGPDPDVDFRNILLYGDPADASTPQGMAYFKHQRPEDDDDDDDDGEESVDKGDQKGRGRSSSKRGSDTGENSDEDSSSSGRNSDSDSDSGSDSSVVTSLSPSEEAEDDEGSYEHASRSQRTTPSVSPRVADLDSPPPVDTIPALEYHPEAVPETMSLPSEAAQSEYARLGDRLQSSLLTNVPTALAPELQEQKREADEDDEVLDQSPTTTSKAKPTPKPPPTHRESTTIIIKPHACRETVWHFVLNRLELCGLSIEHYGLFKTSKEDNMNLFDRQHAAMATAALLNKPGELHIADEGQKMFLDAFAVQWSDAIVNGWVHNAADMLAILDLSSSKLSKLWKDATQRGSVVRLGPNEWVAKMDGLHVGMDKRLVCAPDTYCVNGFFYALRQEHQHPKSKSLVVEVSWDEARRKTGKDTDCTTGSPDLRSRSFSPGNQTWSSVLDYVVGPMNPAEAPRHSLRGAVFRDWIALGLDRRPTDVHDVCHVAGSAFEAMVARSVWRAKTNSPEPFSITTDPLACRLISAGIPAQTIKWWMSDPFVQGKTIYQRLHRLSIPETVAACVALYSEYSGHDKYDVDLRRYYYGHTGSSSRVLALERKIHPV